MLRSSCRFLLVFMALARAGSSALGQAPSLTLVQPNGAQRGTSVEVVLTGANLAGPSQLWTSFPAQVTIPTDANNGKDNGRLRVRIQVPKEAAIGPGSIRLATTRGLSNFQVFCVDSLPQVVQSEKSRSVSSAPRLPVPSVVVGRTKPETRDYYKVQAAVGQRLSFDVLARRLGTPLDPQLRILDATTAQEVAYCEDAPGLQGDARLTYTFVRAGEYLIEVHDTLWRGGEAFGYRLRVGDFPCATTGLPMAIERGQKTTVHVAGSNVQDTHPVEVLAPRDPSVNALWITPQGGNGLAGWPVVVGVSDLEELIEHEPNGKLKPGTRVPIPGAISGRFLHKGDTGQYGFHGKKGQALHIRAWTHEFGSPTEVDMLIRDAKGVVVAELNPQAPSPADRQMDFTPPADGDYTLAVSQLVRAFGPTETYRITIEPSLPDFSLVLASTRFSVAQNGDVAIPVPVVRRGYTGPIALKLVGPAGLAGQGAVAAGQAAGSIGVNAAKNQRLGFESIAIEGTATVGGRKLVRFAAAPVAVSRNFADLPFPPLPFLRQIGIAVTPRAPFTLTARLEGKHGSRGASAPLTVTAIREPGFVEPIQLSVVGLPGGIGPALPAIGKGRSQVAGKLNIAANAPLGSFAFQVVGVTSYRGLELRTHAAQLSLTVAVPKPTKKK